MSDSPNRPEIRGELAKKILAEKVRICTECETENTGLDIFCSNCGTELVEPPIDRSTIRMICTNCGSATDFASEWEIIQQKYCVSCGTSLFGTPLPRVGFFDAIKLGFKNYFNFSGRSRRSEYWYWVLFRSLSVGITLLFSMTVEIGFMILFFISIFGTIIPSLSIAIRRLHDTGKSAWWIFLTLVPFGGFVLLVFYTEDSKKLPNEYGSNPKYGH